MITETTLSKLTQEIESGMSTLLYATLMPPTTPSYNLLEHYAVSERKSISLLEEVRQWNSKHENGWLIMALYMTTLKCEGPIHEQMIMCSRCGGVVNLGYRDVYGLSLKIELVSLKAGEKRAIPVCKCDQETSKLANKPETATIRAMGANEYQVGGNHYREPIQHWDLIIANKIPYLEAQVIKYVMRWRKKNGLEDLLKAQHYLAKLIETERPGESVQNYAAGPEPGYVDQDRAGQGVAGRSVPIGETSSIRGAKILY